MYSSKPECAHRTADLKSYPLCLIRFPCPIWIGLNIDFIVHVPYVANNIQQCLLIIISHLCPSNSDLHFTVTSLLRFGEGSLVSLH